MASYFTRMDPPLPPMQSDTDMEAAPFLDATKQIVPFFDLLGKAFLPVKHDVDGNLKKLQRKLDSDPEKYRTFRAMLEEDVKSKQNKNSASATLSLLWLKRALQFMCEFFNLIIRDHRAGIDSENMGLHCRQAYERTLRPYHNWITQKLFSIVSRAVPHRRDFLKALANSSEAKEEDVINEMAHFYTQLSANVDVIHQMYVSMGLDYPDKV